MENQASNSNAPKRKYTGSSNLTLTMFENERQLEGGKSYTQKNLVLQRSYFDQSSTPGEWKTQHINLQIGDMPVLKKLAKAAEKDLLITVK